jgi:intracellular sulfur oxidation DsrE/DsrF family protein
MRLKSAAGAFSFFMILFIALTGASQVQGGEAHKGHHHTKVVFDFRDRIPESALVHLQLVHETFKDMAAQAAGHKPEFAVVFMGESVKLLTSHREKFSPEEKDMLAKLDQTISALTADGATLEVCVFAADFFGVYLKSFSPKIKKVKNGWIASIGYQSNGFTLVPIF